MFSHFPPLSPEPNLNNLPTPDSWTMGACCCGIPRVKTIAATDFFETFEHSLFLLHQSIRRSVETASDRNRVLISDDDYDSYFDYCSMAIQYVSCI